MAKNTKTVFKPPNGFVMLSHEIFGSLASEALGFYTAVMALELQLTPPAEWTTIPTKKGYVCVNS